MKSTFLTHFGKTFNKEMAKEKIEKKQMDFW